MHAAAAAAAGAAVSRRLPVLRRSSYPPLIKLSPSLSSSFRRCFCSDELSRLRDRIHLVTEKPSASDDSVSAGSDDISDSLRSQICDLAGSLLAATDPISTLESLSAANLLRRASSNLFLLSRLSSNPALALQVFDWRRKQAGLEVVLPEEYAKVIKIAGRAKSTELAAELFSAARATRACSSSVYNALMAAYMLNGYTRKAVSVFNELKRDCDCEPTIVSYNILLSVYGRSMSVDRLEEVLDCIQRSSLVPTLSTYNTVIAAYVTAWKWDRMEWMFDKMEEFGVEPDMCTHLLMLRGYAHAGYLEKMEKTYELVRDHVNDREAPLLRAMICAYCKSSDPERVKKIEELAKHIPGEEYRPWLNVLLIRLYAQEGLIELMERFISEAFQRNTVVTTVGVMRSIISGYFKCNSVDRLVGFIGQAEHAGWRVCRSLYHCKMVMYGKQNRLQEMHSVLDEMEHYHLDPTRKTFLIMYKAYENIGRRSEANTIVGLMWKNGLGNPHDAFLM